MFGSPYLVLVGYSIFLVALGYDTMLKQNEYMDKYLTTPKTKSGEGKWKTTKKKSADDV